MNKSIAALIVGTCLASPLAIAQSNDTGWYLGLGAGRAYLEDDNRLVGVDFDADDTAMKVYFGYKINQYIAIEGSYADWGEPDDRIGGNKYEADLSGFGGFVMGILPVTDRFDLFAKIGVYLWDAELENKRTNLELADEDGYNLGFGFGAGYDLTNNVGIRVEFEAVDADTLDDAYAGTVGIHWQF
ncbi:outer membrane beta-barrel protein [Exilibacterium tricleocarpae]|nr:outer membrane beta-barrel protein [Exilibacterium tricleocarpae]